MEFLNFLKVSSLILVTVSVRGFSKVEGADATINEAGGQEAVL